MIDIRAMTISQGAFHLQDISFQVPTGEYAVLMGKTGTGKTTILEAVCGLTKIVSGKVSLMGVDVTHTKTANRGIGYVPQDLALFPLMTVRNHLAFALQIRKADPEEIQRQVDELSDLLGIAHLMGRTPRDLSGGEAQRVALGRALSATPRVLCLDEPLAALDDETREEMCVLLTEVKQRTGVTTIHVTHNLSEARRLADRVFLIKDGTLVNESQ